MVWSNIPDFASSLALLLVLSLGYGAIDRQVSVSCGLTNIMLGLMFGIVAWLQMHRPFEPVDGLIIDMRNVPIVLAGAFLGWRGLGACLAIAIATRFSIGGVGMEAGVLAMILVAMIGGIWRVWTAHKGPRKPLDFIALGLATSLSMSAAVVLPYDIMIVFLSTAGTWLAGLYLVTVPLAAWVLDREMTRRRDERYLREVASAQTPTRLLHESAFRKEMEYAMAAGEDVMPAGLVHIAPGRTSWLTAFRDDETLEKITAVLRLHLTALFPNLIAMTRGADGGLILALDRSDFGRASDTVDDVRTRLAHSGIALGPYVRSSVTLNAKIIATPLQADLARALSDLDRGPRSIRRATPHARRHAAGTPADAPLMPVRSHQPAFAPDNLQDTLFARADRKMHYAMT